MQRDTEEIYPLGCKRKVAGEYRVHYYGYWIKIYEPPADSLSAKKKLIEALTRRLFNHVEHGINIPGSRLTEARAAYDAEQDPALWSKPLIEDARRYCGRALGISGPGPRILQMMIHALWCGRKSLADPPPWKAVLAAYDILVELRDDAIIRINRAVALAEVKGAEEALAELDGLDAEALSEFLPFHAARADLLVRIGRVAEALQAYDRALVLSPGEAERRFLERRRDALIRS